MPGDLPDFTQSVSGLASATVFNGSIGPAGSVDLDVSAYQSVIVLLFPAAGAPPAICKFAMLGPTFVTMDYGLLSADTTVGGSSWTLPVTGPTLRLTREVGSLGTLNVFVTGTNRQLPRALGFPYWPSRQFSLTKAIGVASGTNTRMVSSDSGVLHPEYTSYNGPVIASLSISGGASITSNFLYVAWLESDGTRNFIALGSTAATGSFQFTFAHPYAHCSWFIQNFGVPTTAQSATVDIIPFAVST